MNRLDHTRRAAPRGTQRPGRLFRGGRPRSRSFAGAAARPAGGGRGRDRAGHAVQRSGGRRPDPAAGQCARALAGGQTEAHAGLVRALRETESRTPVVLMGYLNPILRHGVAAFARDAGEAGVDGLILVDLPLEHAGEIDRQLREHGMHLIRMSAPTSEDARLADTLRDAGGFVYHIMLAGTTGAELPDEDRIAQALARCARIRACRWRRVSACARRSRPGWWAGMPIWWRSVPGWPRCWPSAACPARWRKCGCWPARCGSSAGRTAAESSAAAHASGTRGGRRRAVGVHAVVAHVGVGNPARLRSSR